MTRPATLHLPAEHSALRRLRPWLSHVDGIAELDDTTLGRLELCVHELASNVVDHSGASSLRIEAERRADGVELRLVDDGDPAELPVSLDRHPRIGGYGLLIADQLASQLTYHRTPEGNVWVVEFSLVS